MSVPLYIHIPFCHKKCLYCDFYSVPYLESQANTYAKALIGQITSLPAPFSSVYVGGGTPTILEPETLSAILSALAGRLAPGAEFTIEANPDSITEHKLAIFKDRGVSRISIGVQSLRDEKLRGLGRIHNSRRAEEAVKLARRMGFENVSIDLIYGAWSDSAEDWKDDLGRALNLPVTHLSCYALTYEQKTPIYDALRQKTVIPLEDEAVAEMYMYAIERLSSAGFKQYEVSSFSKEGFECRHNLSYWTNEPYFGLGASAVSYIDGVRSQNVTDVEGYLGRVLRGEDPTESREKLSPIEAAKETAALKIRTKDGIDFSWFKEKTGFDFMALEKKALDDLLGKGLLKEIKKKDAVTGVRLRQKGFLFCDMVSSAFL